MRIANVPPDVVDFRLGNIDLSSHVHSIDYDEDRTWHEVTTFGNSPHWYVPGLSTRRLTIGGSHEIGDGPRPKRLIDRLVGADSTPFALQVRRDNCARFNSGSGIVAGCVEATPVAGFVLWSADLLLNKIQGDSFDG